MQRSRGKGKDGWRGRTRGCCLNAYKIPHASRSPRNLKWWAIGWAASQLWGKEGGGTEGIRQFPLCFSNSIRLWWKPQCVPVIRFARDGWSNFDPASAKGTGLDPGYLNGTVQHPAWTLAGFLWESLMSWLPGGQLWPQGLSQQHWCQLHSLLLSGPW